MIKKNWVFCYSQHRRRVKFSAYESKHSCLDLKKIAYQKKKKLINLSHDRTKIGPDVLKNFKVQATMILHDALVFTPVLGYDVTSVIALTSRIFSHENGDCQLILLSLRFRLPFRF